MSVIKSYSVNNGDMFYISHGSDSFTIIDCCLSEGTKDIIINDLISASKLKGIKRFISTHPDDDHLRGIEELNARMPINNFYCVKNEATKDDQTDSFKKYCEFRDGTKTFFIFKNCKRKWMNEKDDERGSAGISILWPELTNSYYIEELALAKEGNSPNNISPIIRYSSPGASFLWMGDLETEFMIKTKDEMDLSQTDIVFAPHHGRDSGRIPDELLEILKPKIIVVGEAPSEHLHYYPGYNTITQNSAGDIVFDSNSGSVDIFTSKEYQVDFLKSNNKYLPGMSYIGSLEI